MSGTVVVGGLELPARWLRDHGDDEGSVDPASGQRVVDTFAIDAVVEAVSVTEANDVATVDWSDGATTSHRLDALRDLASRPRRPRPPSPVPVRVPPVPASPGNVAFPAADVDDDRAWVDALRHLRDHGWVAFEGAELGPGPIGRLADRLGYVRASIFGTVWEMNAGADEHQDSAYDPVALDVHTDGTYSHDAPGTIVFAQQAKEGEGGDSVLVDGFDVAADLARDHPEHFDLLTRYEIRGRYVEPGVSLVADRVPIRADAEGVVRQISFNNYDRAAVLPADGWVDAVIDAYAAFRSLMVEPARVVRLPWTPGRMLVVDNWRMLHGRTAYTGHRGFLGCYTNHEDLESAWRLAGLD